jgi:thiol:disulfide interchange protein DsbA
VHYETLANPVRTSAPDKIEVTELFWYGCGHCFRFEPLALQWKAKAPADVAFVQSPAMWNKTMELHARAFYTAKALKVFDKVHQPLFNAMNIERKRLSSPEEIYPIFAAQGVSEEDFKKHFSSFTVTSMVKQADARARGYRITGTPSVVVDGRYRVSTKGAGGHTEMLKVVDHLVAKIRSEKS